MNKRKEQEVNNYFYEMLIFWFGIVTSLYIFSLIEIEVGWRFSFVILLLAVSVVGFLCPANMILNYVRVEKKYYPVLFVASIGLLYPVVSVLSSLYATTSIQIVQTALSTPMNILLLLICPFIIFGLIRSHALKNIQ